MDERQMTINVLITEREHDWRGKWSAQLYKAEDLDSADETMLRSILEATGDTPLEAAANLLAMAAAQRRRYT